MARAFEESHQAYSRGDGALAKQLSNQGKDHQRRMEQLNKEASDWIFAGQVPSLLLHGTQLPALLFITAMTLENNKVRTTYQPPFLPFLSPHQNRKPGEVDLHGLYVKEAVARTDQALQSAKARGDTHLNLIVGKVEFELSYSIYKMSQIREGTSLQGGNCQG